MVANAKARARFIAAGVQLCDEHDFDGVDYNWEYPGYDFRSGYQAEAQVVADYRGLAALVRETKAATGWGGRTLSLAYYPDVRQERLLADIVLGDDPAVVDWLHAMAYDQGQGHHSSFLFAEKVCMLSQRHCHLRLPLLPPLSFLFSPAFPHAGRATQPSGSLQRAVKAGPPTISSYRSGTCCMHCHIQLCTGCRASAGVAPSRRQGDSWPPVLRPAHGLRRLGNVRGHPPAAGRPTTGAATERYRTAGATQLR